MGNKKKRNNKPRPEPERRESHTWMIIAIIAIIFSVALMAKFLFFPSTDQVKGVKVYEVPSQGDQSLDGQVWLVASNFRCACGGCGELPLVECDCNMPRGAIEEKKFIRDNLKKRLPVNEVINRVEKKYGLKIT